MVVDLSGNGRIHPNLLSEVNTQVIFKKAVLGVIIVDLLEMNMNHPELYRNCIFVNRTSLEPLLKFIGDRIDALVEKHRPHGTPLSIGISSLRNSAKVLAICNKQGHAPLEKAPKKHYRVTDRDWSRKKTPEWDDSTSFSWRKIRKVIDEDRDFYGHHDDLH